MGNYSNTSQGKAGVHQYAGVVVALKNGHAQRSIRRQVELSVLSNFDRPETQLPEIGATINAKTKLLLFWVFLLCYSIMGPKSLF